MITNKANVLGVFIDLVRVENVIEKISAVISSDARAVILHVHTLGLNIAYDQEWFRQYLNQADMVTCDGWGVKLAGSFLGYKIPQRFTLGDWMWQLAEIAEERGYTLFLLGNPPGSPERAANRLLERYPKLRILGTHHGYFNKSTRHLENESVIEQINQVKPNLLMVGFGMPAQEKWMKENLPRLHINVAMSCGGLFEVLAGDYKRGPHWMTSHYLEWLGHLIYSPRRSWKRYLIGNPLFMVRILKQRMFKNTSNIS